MSKPSDKPYGFRFYVNAENDYSMRIARDLLEILDEKIKDQYEFEMVNILFKNKLAKADGVTITPTLVKFRPDPVERFSGMFNRIEKVRLALGGIGAPGKPAHPLPPG